MSLPVIQTHPEPIEAQRRAPTGGATLLLVLLVVTGFAGFGGMTAILETTGPRAFGLEAAVGLRDFSHRMAQAVRRHATVRTAQAGAVVSPAHALDLSPRFPAAEVVGVVDGLFGLSHLQDLPPPTA